MKIVEIIPAKVWENKKDGRHVSIYGACPGPKNEWEIVQIGWTWRNENGTVGLGRQPAKTRKEAVSVKVKNNARHKAQIRATKDFYKR